MKIAIVHPYPVHRRAVGGTTRVYELVKFLSRRHAVSVFTHEGPGTREAAADLAEQGIAYRAFARPAASLRRKAAWWLDAATPYYVRHNENAALAAALSRPVGQPFDVVHVEFGYLAPVLDGLGPATVRSLAEQEAMPFVIDRLRRVPFGSRTAYERLAIYTARKIEAFDARTLSSFDLLYGITPRERDYLALASRRPVDVLPHVVNLSRFADIPGAETSHDTVLYVGNFHHRPNVYAVEWFVREVWPRVIVRAPAARFAIVGAGLDDTLARRLRAPGVVMHGFQEDLAASYRHAAVVVNPVHSGGGMRGKVLEAFASARPVVSTTMGLEGIAAGAGEHCAVGDSPGEFAAGVIGYLSDSSLRGAHGAAARALVRARYDAPVVFARLEEDFERARRSRSTADVDAVPVAPAERTIA